MTEGCTVVNCDNEAILGSKVRTAKTFFARLRGLLGTDDLPDGQGLLIRPCNSVHTVGMRYAIDVLFLNRSGEVLKIVADMPPMRAAACFASAMALELSAGTAVRTGTLPGHRLEFARTAE